MSREGDPATNPPPSQEALSLVTLRSCRDGLRAAVRLLALIAPDHHGESGVVDEGSFTGGPEATVQNEAILREFEAAEQAYDDLITNISHDVKTSLTIIRGHAQMAARAIRRGDSIDPEALLATLTMIDASALRISTELDGRIDDRSTDPD